PRLRAEAGMPGQLNSFMDGSMIGNALEPKDLVEPQSQQILQPWLLLAPPRLLFDQPVERSPPAHNAINQFLAEAPIGGRQPGAAQGNFEEIFDEFTPRAFRSRPLGGDVCHRRVVGQTCAFDRGRVPSGIRLTDARPVQNTGCNFSWFLATHSL